MFGTNCAPILYRHLHYLEMDRNEIPMTHVTYQFHPVCQKKFLSQWYIWHKLSTYLASR
jgi:hypothetical protein